MVAEGSDARREFGVLEPALVGSTVDLIFPLAVVCAAKSCEQQGYRESDVGDVGERSQVTRWKAA